MQHTFFQKLILIVLAGAFAAGFYVFVYKGLILGAEQSVNGGYKPAIPLPLHTPTRRY